MKSLLLLPIIYFGMAFTTLKPALFNEKVVKIANESELTISGSTNINRFECNYKIEKLTGPITVVYQKNQKSLDFRQTVLKLDNNCFDCGSKPINRDFNILVKSDQHPRILLKIDKVLNIGGTEADVLTDIKIAGITKSYRVPVGITKLNGNNLKVSGVLKLNISDFKLEPPKKMFGIIKVDDIINIDFRLILKDT
ncbi:YceI family protein [Zhouia amylolytica]|nr:YceI family protein [Zhouia amylolytica]